MVSLDELIRSALYYDAERVCTAQVMQQLQVRISDIVNAQPDQELPDGDSQPEDSKR